jgi:hypothetical protein
LTGFGAFGESIFTGVAGFKLSGLLNLIVLGDFGGSIT